MLISYPNSRARAATTASIFAGWSAVDKLYDSDARMAYVWLRTTTPIRLLFSVLKIAPLKFILTNLASGGFHLAFGFGIARGVGGSTTKNSANFSFAYVAIWSEV